MNLDPAYILIKRFEGCVLHAYQDIVGVWTIGYGTTGPDVHQGMVISKETAIRLMEEDVKMRVEKIKAMVHVPCGTNELCALVSLAYHIGIHRLEASTLIREFNAGADKVHVGDCFLMFIKAAGHTVPSFVTRRKAERELFLTPDLEHIEA